MPSGLRIVLLCVGAAIGYGLIHDQVTAHLCVEYFTVGHPLIVPSSNPTVLAFWWGAAATWWVGLALGIPLATAAQRVSPPLTASDLVRPVGIVLVVAGCAALLAGITGYILASRGVLHLEPWLASRIPPTHHATFFADWWAHITSYLAGIAGGGVLVLSVKRGRIRSRQSAGI